VWCSPVGSRSENLPPSDVTAAINQVDAGYVTGERSDIGSASVQPKVSIVVPVFDTERYLGGCLESLVRQTIDEVEIIVVDDRSPGDVKGAVAAVAAGDSRVRLLPLAHNVGVMEARHVGALAARAQYLTFVDPDDEVEPTFVEVLLEAAVTHGADVVECSFSLVDNGATRVVRRSEPGMLEGPSVLQGFLSGRMNNAVWNKLFRADLWRRATAPEVRRIGFAQDLLCVFLVAEQCDRYVRIDDALYRYLPREGSVTKAVEPERVVAQLRGLDAVYRTVRAHLAERFEPIDPVRSLFDREFVEVAKQLLELSGRASGGSPLGIPGLPPTPLSLGLMGSVAFRALEERP
jgi:hypothetical protein